ELEDENRGADRQPDEKTCHQIAAQSDHDDWTLTLAPSIAAVRCERKLGLRDRRARTAARCWTLVLLRSIAARRLVSAFRRLGGLGLVAALRTVTGRGFPTRDIALLLFVRL